MTVLGTGLLAVCKEFVTISYLYITTVFSYEKKTILIYSKIIV
jgi:hypothetical protein